MFALLRSATGSWRRSIPNVGLHGPRLQSIDRMVLIGRGYHLRVTYVAHPFSLRQLQYAVAVAEELSFRRAAMRCNVSQPSLSGQIAQLEGALGVQLFERTRKRVLVTPAGQQLVERAKAALREADELVAASRRAGDPVAGAVCLGIIPTISPYLLPSVAPRLR